MLRQYQQSAIEQFESGRTKNALLCMPTGSGKTFTFCEIAKRHFAANATRVLILVHREELLKQAYDSLGEMCFKIQKGVRHIPSFYNYYVGMVETVNRRLEKMPEFGLVIIDECHFGNFAKMPFFELPETNVLGVTATPIAKKPLKNQYERLINPITINQLIRDKYLVDCKVYGFASDLVNKQKFKVKRGEFDEKQMQDFYSSPKMVSNIVNAYWEYSRGKKTIIFNVNVAHNNAVYSALKQEGLNAYCIDGMTEKKQRKQIIKNFNEQTDAIICNVGVLTTGFDCPDIQVVMLNRATKSLSLYLQMIGRGSRISEGKDHFTVIDLGGNTNRHGFYDDFYDWNKYFCEGTEKDKSKAGAAPTKECPECGFITHPRALECESCGFDYAEARAQKEKEEKEEKFFLLTKSNPIQIPMEKLFEIAEQRGWKPFAVLFRIANHIVKYQQKYSDIVPDEYVYSMALEKLEEWCKRYGNKNNKWLQNTMMDIIKKEKENV